MHDMIPEGNKPNEEKKGYVPPSPLVLLCTRLMASDTLTGALLQHAIDDF